VIEMAKRYSERTTRESPLSPLDLGLLPQAHHTTVTDLKTGKRGEGWSWNDPQEAREKAWKDLRERQGS
jgi:hypothetical protein